MVRKREARNIPELSGRRTLLRLHIRLIERAAKIGGKLKLKKYRLATDEHKWPQTNTVERLYLC